MESIKNKQEIMKALGSYGGYFLSLLYIAEQISNREIDPVRAAVECKKEKIIDTDYSMLEPEKILFKYTGIRFSVKKEHAGYRIGNGEYEILVLGENAFFHFVVGDGNENVVCDPSGNSGIGTAGKILRKMIFSRIESV